MIPVEDNGYKEDYHYRHVSYDCIICTAGAFSRVFKGSFKEMAETESIPVAIKTIKSKIYKVYKLKKRSLWQEIPLCRLI